MTLYDHRNESAELLGLLNSGGTQLVEDTLRLTIKKLLEAERSEPIRILDIGCGTTPYLSSLVSERLSLTLVDKDEKIIETHWIKNRSHNDVSIFPSDYLRRDFNDAITKDKPYDIVVLAFVLHEFRAQLALRILNQEAKLQEANDQSDPAEILLRRLATAPFVGQETTIILSDVFHWHFWNAKILDEAREFQLEVLEHADPASAFLSGADVIRHATCADLMLETYNTTASVNLESINNLSGRLYERLYSLCFHEKYGRIFRSRRAFCATLKRKTQNNLASSFSADQAFRTCKEGMPEVIREGLAGREELQTANLNNLVNLRKLLNNSEIIESSSYDKYLGRGLFRSMAQSAGELAENWFATTQVTAPQSISFWFGINSLVLKEGRYALKEGEDDMTSWQCHYVKFDGAVSVEVGYKQDWTSLCFNHFSSPNVVKYIADPINWLDELPAPSIYNWMTHYSVNSPTWRSVSVICQPDADNNSLIATAHVIEDALILRNYTPPSTSLKGHELIALPGHESSAYSLGAELDRRCSGRYCSENPSMVSSLEEVRTAVSHAISAVYLDSIFLARGYAADKSLRTTDLLDKFEQRWLSAPQVRFFDSTDDFEELKRLSSDGFILLPERMKEQISKFIKRVKANPPNIQELPVIWSCFIVKQPGSADPPIATIMFMSDRPFDPALLELFKAQFEEIFFSIREVEAGRIVRLEERSQAIQTMLRSFGHDGRRYATGITSALGNGSNIGNLAADERMAIGRWLAQNLASRLYVYQTLIGNVKITDSDYKDETSRANHIAQLSSLIRREVAVLLLRSAVEESEFQHLAESLKLAGVKEHLVGFAINALEEATPYPSRALEKLEHSIQQIIKISWHGFDNIGIPTDLNAEGNRTPVSRISVGLGFIISELLTNVFRHQLSQISKLDQKLPLSLVFSLRQQDKGYDLEIRTKPAFKPSIRLSKPNPTGLASLAFIARALQVHIPSRKLQAGSNSVHYPFPTFHEVTGEMVSSIEGISRYALIENYEG